VENNPFGFSFIEILKSLIALNFLDHSALSRCLNNMPGIIEGGLMSCRASQLTGQAVEKAWTPGE
jgi:hypothetical protein